VRSPGRCRLGGWNPPSPAFPVGPSPGTPAGRRRTWAVGLTCRSSGPVGRGPRDALAASPPRVGRAGGASGHSSSTRQPRNAQPPVTCGSPAGAGSGLPRERRPRRGPRWRQHHRPTTGTAGSRPAPPAAAGRGVVAVALERYPTERTDRGRAVLDGRGSNGSTRRPSTPVISTPARSCDSPV
jgi:hypothetical protein